MPREYEDTGRGDLTHYRLERIEEEHRAHAEHCELARKEIWQEIDAMKKEASEADKKMAVAQMKLGLLVGILSAVGGALLTYAMKHVP